MEVLLTFSTILPNNIKHLLPVSTWHQKTIFSRKHTMYIQLYCAICFYVLLSPWHTLNILDIHFTISNVHPLLVYTLQNILESAYKCNHGNIPTSMSSSDTTKICELFSIASLTVSTIPWLDITVNIYFWTRQPTHLLKWT